MTPEDIAKNYTKEQIEDALKILKGKPGLKNETR